MHSNFLFLNQLCLFGFFIVDSNLLAGESKLLMGINLPAAVGQLQQVILGQLTGTYQWNCYGLFLLLWILVTTFGAFHIIISIFMLRLCIPLTIFCAILDMKT